MQDAPTENPHGAPRVRPKLDLTLSGGKERKRGKSMFGLLVGTLNKAKNEDKERNASEAVCGPLLTSCLALTNVVRAGQKAADD